MRKGLYGVVALLALACASCGNGLVPVSGTVTYRGEPAVGATVFLQRQGGDPLKEQMTMGVVGADGTFTLVCGHLGAGVPPGAYDVLIEWKQGSNRAKGRATKMLDRLKGRYADPSRPRFHAIITAKTNRLPSFELTD